MVDNCKCAEHCSAYKRGACLGCDCDCIIEGTDEADWFKELGFEKFQDYDYY